VLEKSERNKCLQDLEIAVKENDNATRKIVVIMGGDGSLATTIKFLRTSPVIDLGLTKGKVNFVMLPFGTGNDGAQVFGWGNSPANELWLQDIESLMRDLVKSHAVDLSLWNCEVDGEVYSAAGEKLDKRILMVYYFNLGTDAKVGLDVERNRQKRRCCNYILYVYYGAKTFF
jgi:diacylglycerol kinase family enzyme